MTNYKTFTLGQLFLEIDNMQQEMEDLEFEVGQRRLTGEKEGYFDMTTNELEQRAEMIERKMSKLLDVKIQLPFKDSSETKQTIN